MATNNYRIKIIKEGLEFEAEGDKKFVLDMLNRFEGEGAKPSGKGSKTSLGQKKIGTSKVPISTKSVSIGEFIRQLGLKKHTDIVLAFGYYLEKYSGLSEFIPADINTCYYDSKMESSNTSQMIIQNIKQGRIMESKKVKGKKKSYVLTHTGEDVVKSWLNKENQ